MTVAVLAAISGALAGYLGDRGEDTSTLGAEVPMAKAGARQANNHFGNVGVGLYPQLSCEERTLRIAAELISTVPLGGQLAIDANNDALRTETGAERVDEVGVGEGRGVN